MDIDVKNESGVFKYRVIGVLIDEDDRLLIQEIVGNDFYCLPGGRVELGESSEEAIAREMSEELGFEVNVERAYFYLENFFKRKDGRTVHEVSLYFKITSKFAPKEDWELVENDKGVLKTLKYKWVKISDLEKYDIRPPFIKEKLLNLSKNFEHIIIHED